MSTTEECRGPRANVRTLSDVVPERVQWLWPGWLPIGKLVILDGDPSVGKSTLTADWAARVSTGTPWPDGSDCIEGDVLLLSAEDGLADTIRPRLDAAGGNPSRIHALESVSYLAEDGTTRARAFNLSDVTELERTVSEHRPRLVLIDVLMAFMPGGVDSNKDTDVRTVLGELARMAERYECCIVALRHMNKSGGSKAMYRGGGSIGIIGAARVGMLAGLDPNDETEESRVLAVYKSNLAETPVALTYKLESAPDHGCGRIVWTGTSVLGADGLLAAQSGDAEEMREIDAWLLDYIEHAGGEAKARDVINDGKTAGFTEDAIKRARKRLRIRTERNGFGKGSVVAWSIGAPIEVIEAGNPKPAPMAPMSHLCEPGPNKLLQDKPCKRCGNLPDEHGLGDTGLCLGCETSAS
ncbi:MAG: AAA family ATPase [Nocardioidaceae bacterium]|nr:AAA family ATPase [Nocardioidaceae bacterium]